MNKTGIKETVTVSGYTLIAGYLGIVMIMAGVITLLPLITLAF